MASVSGPTTVGGEPEKRGPTTNPDAMKDDEEDSEEKRKKLEGGNLEEMGAAAGPAAVIGEQRQLPQGGEGRDEESGEEDMDFDRLYVQPVEESRYVVNLDFLFFDFFYCFLFFFAEVPLRRVPMMGIDPYRVGSYPDRIRSNPRSNCRCPSTEAAATERTKCRQLVSELRYIYKKKLKCFSSSLIPSAVFMKGKSAVLVINFLLAKIINSQKHLSPLI